MSPVGGSLVKDRQSPEGGHRILGFFEGQRFCGLAPRLFENALTDAGVLERHPEWRWRIFNCAGDCFGVARRWFAGQVREVKSQGQTPAICLAGFSHGGDAARKAAGALRLAHLDVDLLVLLDPIKRWRHHGRKELEPAPANVKRTINIVQQKDPMRLLWFRLHGYKVAPGENEVWEPPKEVAIQPWVVHVALMEANIARLETLIENL